MNGLAHRASLAFAAGCLGGLANSLAVWLFGLLGITTSLGVKIAPLLTATWLYPRIVWGGLWGFLFLLPYLARSTFWRGVVWSIGPSLGQLLVVFPLKAQKGMLGLEVGALTPVFVLLFNAVWGIAAAYWLRYIEREG